MVRDMTSGNPRNLILSFCLPLLAGNIFQQCYNLADTIIVGRFLGVSALAAVGATGSLNFLVLGFVNGLTSGMGIPVAQAFGGGLLSDMRKFCANAVYLCLGFTAVLTGATLLGTGGLLLLMKTPDDIFQYSYDYISILFAGIVCTMFYNLLSTILRSLGDSKTPLIFLTLASILNIVLDLVFIINFDMGVKGAALATVISQGVSAALCAVTILLRFPVLRLNRHEAGLDVLRINRLLDSGVPMALQFSITAMGSIILQSAVNSLGSIVVASVTAASKIQLLFTQPLESLGITMATFCGQNLGAGRVDRVRNGLKQSMIMGLGFAVLIGVVVSLWGANLSGLFINQDEISLVQDNLTQFLRMNAFFYIPLGLIFILRNSLQGLGYGFLPMTAGIFELVGRAAVAFLLVAPLGFQAVCLANPAAWVAADILLIPAMIVKLKELARKLPPPLAEEGEE